VAEHLPSKHKTVSSNSSTANKKKSAIILLCRLIRDVYMHNSNHYV
jgi:hypothetical protein